jgi:hypothetical protein
MLLFAALGALSVSGCLIAEAPDYGEPRRTTPIIDRLSVVPQPIFQVELMRDEPKQFSMTIFSEDAGEDLVASYFLNYKTPRQQEGDVMVLSPRAADQPKDLTFTFTPTKDVPKGCHSLTLFVMHLRSYDLSTQQPIPLKSDGDVATVTWWLDVLVEDTSQALECPTPTMQP